MDEKPKIPEEVVKEISLSETQTGLKITVKVSHDGKQFSIKIPKKIALVSDLEKDDKFEISVENGKDIILRRV